PYGKPNPESTRQGLSPGDPDDQLRQTRLGDAHPLRSDADQGIVPVVLVAVHDAVAALPHLAQLDLFGTHHHPSVAGRRSGPRSDPEPAQHRRGETVTDLALDEVRLAEELGDARISRVSV